MDYQHARPLIEDGDLIAVREHEGVLTPITRFFTSSQITHVGIACWMDGGLWMGELNAGKNHAVPLSQLSETDFDVYYPPVPSRAKVRASLLEALREKIHYAFGMLAAIGLLNWFRINVFIHARKLLVCSGWCVMVYEKADWPERTRVLSPADLVKQLTLKFEVRRAPPPGPIDPQINQPASAGFLMPTP
jgi:hypothetical protein